MVSVCYGETDDGCTHGIGRRVLLLGSEAASSLGSVQSSLSSNNSLSLGGARATGAATNLGGGIPVIHFEDMKFCQEKICVLERGLTRRDDVEDVFVGYVRMEYRSS